MRTDLHIHFGQWFDKYYDPLKIGRELLVKQRLAMIGVSSTTACRDPYSISTICEEVEPLLKAFPGQVFHWLWLHPDFIPTSEDTCAGTPIHGLKIHPYQHDWHSDKTKISRAFKFAENLSIPILLHTGGIPECDVGQFLLLLRQHPTVNVILAHARPMNEAILLAEQCSNAWFDTAFVSRDSLDEAVTAGILHRFVFGTDYPINGPERGMTYDDVIAEIGDDLFPTILPSTDSFVIKHFFGRLTDELLTLCRAIWSSGPDWYKLRRCNRNAFRNGPYPISFNDDSSDEVFTERLKSDLGRRYRKAQDLLEKEKIAQLFVNEWGGIRGHKDGTLRDYVSQTPDQLIDRGLAGIATWSKILTLIDPDRYAIYDARVAAALNLTLQRTGLTQWGFPMPQSFAGSSRRAEYARLKRVFNGSFLAAPIAYRWYLKILDEIARRSNTDKQRVEMALFVYGYGDSL